MRDFSLRKSLSQLAFAGANVGLLVAACGGEAPPPGAPQAFETSLLNSADGSEGAAREPLVPGCVLETAPPHQAWQQPLKVRLSLGGEAVFQLRGVPTQVRLSSGGSGLLKVEGPELTLLGVVQQADLVLYPRGYLWEGPIGFLPRASFRLLGVKASPEPGGAPRLSVEHRLLGPLRFEVDEPLGLELACDELQLSQGEFDLRSGRGVLSRGNYGYLRGGQRLTLYPEPGSSSGASLQVYLPPAQWLEVEVYEPELQGRRRVSYQQGEELFLGWLPSEQIELSPQPLAQISYASAQRSTYPQGKVTHRCNKDLRLGVLSEGRATEIGVLRAGVGFTPVDPSAGFSEARVLPIRLPWAFWFEPAPAASLVVLGATAEACAPLGG